MDCQFQFSSSTDSNNTILELTDRLRNTDIPYCYHSHFLPTCGTIFSLPRTTSSCKWPPFPVQYWIFIFCPSLSTPRLSLTCFSHFPHLLVHSFSLLQRSDTSIKTIFLVSLTVLRNITKSIC